MLVQPASAYPAEVWAQLAAREPLCLVTTLGEDRPVTAAYTPATIRAVTRFGDTVPRLFGRGVTATAVIEGAAANVVVALWPVPTLVVVGDGLIADALRSTAGLLGWSVRVEAAFDAASPLHRCDAVVVLSHDRDVDGPALRDALAGGAGYVGALGSRRTQAARAEWLTAHGVPDADRARIHGPAGLDIDAHTPAEIAISIVAEILAERRGLDRRCVARASRAGAHRRRPGPAAALLIARRRRAAQRLTSSCRNAASRVGVECPSATQASRWQPASADRCSHPGRHCTAPSSRSGNAHSRSSALTCARPNERTPGVSITQPSSSGRRSAIADDDVCRPLPIALTTPVAR